jgi:hypothetical protein
MKRTPFSYACSINLKMPPSLLGGNSLYFTHECRLKRGITRSKSMPSKHVPVGYVRSYRNSLEASDDKPNVL